MLLLESCGWCQPCRHIFIWYANAAELQGLLSCQWAGPELCTLIFTATRRAHPGQFFQWGWSDVPKIFLRSWTGCDHNLSGLQVCQAPLLPSHPCASWQRPSSLSCPPPYNSSDLTTWAPAPTCRSKLYTKPVWIYSKVSDQDHNSKEWTPSNSTLVIYVLGITVT